MQTEVIKTVLEKVSPVAKFSKEQLIKTIQEKGSTKLVGILYAYSGEKFLAVGSRSERVHNNNNTFEIESIIGVEGEFKGYDALKSTSMFAGVHITCKYGMVVNEIHNSPALFANDKALSVLYNLVNEQN